MFSLRVKNKWELLFGVWALQAAVALWRFLSTQSFPLEWSLKKILPLGGFLFWVFGSLFLIFSLFRKAQWLLRVLDWLGKPTVRDGLFTLSALGLFLRLFLGILQSVADRGGGFWFIAYLDPLSPLLNLAAWTLAEILALILFDAFRKNANCGGSCKSFLAKALGILALLGLTALYIAQTNMGIGVIYKGDWARGLPTVPLLEWQILLACLLCVAATRLNLSKIPRLDLWLALAVWVAAAALWLSQPIIPNASALEPRAPNFEIYPFIDAQTYDEFAQSALVGDGFGDQIPQRPLYILFLVFSHALVGQDYAAVIVLQSLVFALFPVLLYLFGSEFFGRPIGLSVALLALLRDFTSNLVSPFTGNLSYSKLYLSEIPTAMLLILLLLLGVRWIKSGFPAFLGLLMGGVLGAAMLIRTQSVVALPVIVLFALPYARSKFPALFKSLALTLATLILVVAPWLGRNWQLSGRPIFDSPESQTINLALRYSRLNGVEPHALPFPDETNAAYNERLQRMTREAILSNPRGAARGIFSSFLNHGINNILLFPLQNDLKNPSELIIPADSFWEEWNGEPTASQLALIIFYLFLFSVGVAAAWQFNGWLGLLPLALNLAYNLWTSLALLSGQRFMLTMDWSIYLYYMIGLFALLGAFFFALEGGRGLVLRWLGSPRPVYESKPKGWGWYLLSAVFFLALGLSLPLAEKVFPQKYPQAQIPALENSACLQTLVAENGWRIVSGRAMYPRYYEAGDGESVTDSVGYKITDEARLVFQLVGRYGRRVIFPMPAPPEFFPNASDAVLALDGSGNVQFVFVGKDGGQALYFAKSVRPACR